MTREEFREFWINTFDNKSDDEKRELLDNEEIQEKLQNFIKSEQAKLNEHHTLDPH